MHRNPADEFADIIAQAVDVFRDGYLLQLYEAVRATGERDCLGADDAEAVYRLEVYLQANYRWRPPRIAEIVEACHRLNIPVQL